MKLDPNLVFLAILRYVPAIIIVVVAIVFIFSYRVVILTDTLERTNIETAENFFSSRLTYDRAVFDPAKLNTFITDANAKFQTSGNVPNIEPEDVARHCRIGYKVEIEDLVDNRKWAFGYVPSAGKENELHLESMQVYSASILADPGKGQGYEDVHAAKMTITMRETYLTEIGCMIEEAYEFKEPRGINIPCIYSGYEGGTGDSSGTKICQLLIEKKDNYICMGSGGLNHHFPEDGECRYFYKPIDAYSPQFSYDYSNNNKKLIAYPLDERLDNYFGYLQDKCKKLNDIYKTNQPPVSKVESVILCLQ
jgi:hypothetical protein